MLTKFDIEEYFIAEKQAGLIFLSLGIIAIITSVVFIFFFKSNFSRGAAIPLIVFGILQCIVGYTVHTRSDNDRIKVVYAYDMNPTEIKTKELPRMEKVNKSFKIIKWVEIAFIIIGVILIFKFKNNYTIEDSWKGNAFILGIAIALTIQAAILLCTDYFAESRALKYTTSLKEYVIKN